MNQAVVAGGSDADLTNNQSNVDAITADTAGITIFKTLVATSFASPLYWNISISNNNVSGSPVAGLVVTDNLGSRAGRHHPGVPREPCTGRNQYRDTERKW